MTKTITTIALVTMSGSALAQSGLDIDRAYAAELRADANTRSSLLGSNAGAIDMEIFTQFRYTFDNRSEVVDGGLGDAEDTIGFSLPRTQVRLDGAVEGTDISGHISFDFGGAFDHGGSRGITSVMPATFAGGDGGATLRDAYASWGINDNWTFLFGQMKNVVNYESNVAPEHSQGVERSLANSFFDLGYTQGIALNYTDDEWKFTVMITDGANASNSFFNAAGEADIAVTGRLDWLVSGNWDQFNDFASWQGSNTGFRVGAGFHWQQAGDTNPSLAPIDTTTFYTWTVDGQYEGDGWGVFASYQSSNTDNDLIAGGSMDQTDDSVVVQANMFVSEQTELFVRYDYIQLEDDPTAIIALPATADDTYSQFTVGMNYYLVPESFAARFSLDLTFGLDDTAGLDARGFADAATTGFVGGSDAGATGTEDNFMIRGQFSLLF